MKACVEIIYKIYLSEPRVSFNTLMNVFKISSIVERGFLLLMALNLSNMQ